MHIQGILPHKETGKAPIFEESTDDKRYIVLQRQAQYLL